MKISIVFPVYNKADQLEQSIESAFAQDYDDLEVIAVDDGSTDNSLEILKKIALRYPKLIIHQQPNGGPSIARNSGLKVSTGEYVMFHDADDVLEPGAIRHLVAVARESDSDIVAGITRRRYGHRAWEITRFKQNIRRVDFSRDRASAIRHSTNFSLCNKLFARDFLRENNLSFTPGLYMQDIEFWIKSLMITCNFSQTDRIITNYNYFENSTSKKESNSRFDSLEIILENLELFMKEHGKERFRTVVNVSILQGAMMFFTRWKLNHWRKTGEVADLQRLRALLLRMPVADIWEYFFRVNSSANALVYLLVRQGRYAAAHRADVAYWRAIGGLSKIAAPLRRA